jgi:hypothetical protein
MKNLHECEKRESKLWCQMVSQIIACFLAKEKLMMKTAKTWGEFHALTQKRGGALDKLQVFDVLRGGGGGEAVVELRKYAQGIKGGPG